MANLGRIVISLEQPPGGTWDHQILRGLQPLLQERDYALIMHDASYNGTRDKPEVPFDAQDMDALIVDGHAATDEYLRQMRAAGIPIVLLGRTLPNSDIPTVMPDNFGGARLAVSHLIDHKHKRIVFVTGDPDTDDGRLREQGYYTAMKEAGLEIDPALIVRGEFNPDVSFDSVEQLLRKKVPFTALFGADDDCALGAMRALQQWGKTIPQDVAIVGFNDLPEAYMSRPSLTTIRPYLRDLGEQAARTLLDLLDGKPVKNLVTMPVELIRRKSCGCI
jgi:DNA-binding LacI/PurR family transcriptional regulator